MYTFRDQLNQSKVEIEDIIIKLILLKIETFSTEMYCLSSPLHTNHIKSKKHEGIQQNLWDGKHFYGINNY